MLAPDHYARFTTTLPARLLAAARGRAELQGLTLAAHLAELVRDDLVAAGVTPPLPPPPKRNGPKPRAIKVKRGARKKDAPPP